MTARSQTLDASTRFILPDDAPYLRNLAALWQSDPALARRLEATHGQPSYPVQASRAGAPTVAVPAPARPAVAGAAERPLFLHSRYEPLEEAQRLADAVDVQHNAGFVCHGFGLGYHVQALVDRAGEHSVFLIFEPDLLLLRTAFEHRDYSAMIEKRRLCIFDRPDKSELLVRLTPHMATLSLGLATLVHTPSLRVAPEFHQQMTAWLDEYASFAKTSLNTLLLNSKRTAENIARNVGWYVSAPSLARLKDRFAGKPAIIVSAGPSLRKNKHLLREAREGAVIVAVQTTLRPLLEMGVEPHFVTSLDYHEICTRFFEGLPPTIRTELIAEPKATSGVFAMHPGPLSLLGNDFAEGLLREMRLNKPSLTPGATVAHLAFYLTEFLGCDPVVFVGQDLGFSDGLCYAPGTSYEDVWRPELGRFCTVEMKQWDQIVRERFILRRIPDYQGRPMYTEERLFTYLQQFERDFAGTRRRVIDATEGGAAKRGAEVMPLAQVLETYCSSPLDIELPPHPGLNSARLKEAEGCILRRRDEAEEIERIGQETLPLLEEIRDHVADQPRVNRGITRIDALRGRMNELGATYDLVTQLTQKTQLDRFAADRKLSSVKLDPLERQRRQVGRDIENVRGVLAAAKRFQVLMDEVIDRLSDRSSFAARADGGGAQRGVMRPSWTVPGKSAVCAAI